MWDLEIAWILHSNDFAVTFLWPQVNFLFQVTYWHYYDPSVESVSRCNPEVLARLMLSYCMIKYRLSKGRLLQNTSSLNMEACEEKNQHQSGQLIPLLVMYITFSILRQKRRRERDEWKYLQSGGLRYKFRVVLF